MADFQKTFENTMGHEGGYVDDPADDVRFSSKPGLPKGMTENRDRMRTRTFVLFSGKEGAPECGDGAVGLKQALNPVYLLFGDEFQDQGASEA